MRVRLILLVSFSVLVLVALTPEVHAKGGTSITTCGQTVTTNAVLSQDMSCPFAEGIVVGASGITIDLKGFTIIGNQSPNHDGIDDSGGYDNVTVKNGTVEDYQRGIDAVNADKIALSNIVASGNALNGIEVEGASPSVKSSNASGNEGDGIVVFGDSSTIVSSIASGNGGHGIEVDGDLASVKSSTASGNAFRGIRIVGNSARLSSFTASGNDSVAIEVDGASGSVKSATASGNLGIGILVVGDSASVTASTAVGNGSSVHGEDGIQVQGDAATVNGNRADANGFVGGAPDGVGLGVRVVGYTTPPTGTNTTRGNDDSAECSPASLC